MLTYFRPFPSLACAAFALALCGCSQTTGASGTATSGATAEQRPEKFATVDVKRQDLTGYRFFDGKLVIPDSARATAFSPYDTPVVSVLTSVGKYVANGEPIVKLTIPGADTATLESKSALNNAKTELKSAAEANSTAVRDARKALDDARAAEKAARDTIASGGQADIDSATTTRQAAEAALDKAKQDLRQATLPQQNAVAQAANSVDAAKGAASLGIVKAPISGTIVSMAAKPGMDAKSQQPLAEIVDYRKARVQGLVPAELKDVVVRRSRVMITFDGASSEPVEGEVLDLSVVAPTEGQKSPGYLANIEFRNPRSISQPGPSVKRVGVKTGSVRDALVVPTGAIHMQDGKAMVTVKNGDQWTETAVETGISDGALTEIKSGLKEGSTVRIQS